MADTPIPNSDRGRRIVAVAMTVVILAVVTLQIVAKERIVRDGTTVLLGLAPQDPRSLMQGDYMALRYAMADEVAAAAAEAGIRNGQIVLELDADGHAVFVALYEGQPLAADRQLLTFRKRGETVRLASDAWFFEEGQWQRFSRARFGELRVADDGEAILAALRDANGNRLSAAIRTPD